MPSSHHQACTKFTTPKTPLKFGFIKIQNNIFDIVNEIAMLKHLTLKCKGLPDQCVDF